MKVGDTVVCIDNKDLGGIGLNKKYVIKDINVHYVYLEGGYDGGYYRNRFKLVEEKEAMCNKWSFKCPSVSRINFNEIYSCMSYKNPVVFIQITNKDGSSSHYVGIHESILYKMNDSTLIHPDLEKFINSGSKNYLELPAWWLYKLNDEREKKDVLRMVREIKDAPYKDRTDSLVTVTMPTI